MTLAVTGQAGRGGEKGKENEVNPYGAERRLQSCQQPPGSFNSAPDDDIERTAAIEMRSRVGPEFEEEFQLADCLANIGRNYVAARLGVIGHLLRECLCHTRDHPTVPKPIQPDRIMEPHKLELRACWEHAHLTGPPTSTSGPSPALASPQTNASGSIPDLQSSTNGLSPRPR